MIELHRLGQGHAFELNPDFIISVEDHPDTTIVLSTGTRVVVEEPVGAVVELIRLWRVGLLADALGQTQASRPVGVR